MPVHERLRRTQTGNSENLSGHTPSEIKSASPKPKSTGRRKSVKKLKKQKLCSTLGVNAEGLDEMKASIPHSMYRFHELLEKIKEAYPDIFNGKTEVEKTQIVKQYVQMYFRWRRYSHVHSLSQIKKDQEEAVFSVEQPHNRVTTGRLLIASSQKVPVPTEEHWRRWVVMSPAEMIGASNSSLMEESPLSRVTFKPGPSQVSQAHGDWLNFST
ncbi:hypothetical protein FA15DRAFT_696026 [Coprinopsis marcescibilis]|uniref:Uncharacterized protein n=1 Tax=Coprinopsis marcescibilis TaxID=230819 RepID=A0A5C3L1A6_COPMA|nr:hypothetical protein FA15DRAFT_696026 [Coprinopsis marcescibilis]